MRAIKRLIVKGEEFITFGYYNSEHYYFDFGEAPQMIDPQDKKLRLPNHTFQRMHQQTYGKLIDRRSRETWEKSGRPDFVEKAYARAMDILSTHKPEPLPDDIQKGIDSIFEEAEAAKKTASP